MTNFKWIGSKVDCYNPFLEKRCFEFYKSFAYNNEEFHIGEFALFNNGCNGSIIPTIGRLLCVYYSPEQENKYRGLVHWYSWAGTISAELNPTNIKLDQKNEVVENEIDDKATSYSLVLLQDIQKKCCVIYAASTDPVNLIKRNNLNPNIYFSCRYKIECNRLVPVFSRNSVNNSLGTDYILANELKHKLDITGLSADGGLTFITESSPLIKTTPNHKRGSDYLKTPRMNLDSEGSDFEEVNINKIKSPSNPMKHIKLTPRSERFSSPLKRNSSVKRVLNDSFGESPTSPSGIPIFSYSVINSACDDNKHIKIKLKLNENESCTNLKVFPTKLNKEVVRMKSPIKLSDLKEINNLIEISSEANDSAQMSLRARSSNTPAKIESRRRSSRIIERKSYVEYLSPEQSTPIKRSRQGSHLGDIKTPLNDIKACLTKISEYLDDNEKFTEDTEDNICSLSSGFTSKQTKNNKIDSNSSNNAVTPRSKRNITQPKKYIDDDCIFTGNLPMQTLKPKLDVYSHKKLDNNSESDDISFKRICYVNIERIPIKNNAQACSGDEDLDHCSVRPKRNVGKPKKYSDDVDGTPLFANKSLKRSNVNGDKIPSPKFPNSSDRPKRSASRPKKYGEDNVNKTPSSTPRHSNKQHNISKIDNYNTDKKSRLHNLHRNILMNSCKKLSYDNSDDEDFCTSKTPKCGSLKTKTTPKSTPSAKAKMIREGMITPSVQAREIALKKDDTPLSKARTQLHVSYVPNSLPCREKEFSDIINFLEGKLVDGCGGCMYISGVPGTGKTATVTEVVRNLKKASEKREIPSFTCVIVNGMKLSEPRQAYVEIMKQLTGKTVHWEQAQMMLENKFVKSQKKTLPIILIVDELDILCTKRQDVVYNLLDWPTKVNTQLIVVTIANTMDLPERLLMGRVTSRLGLTRLPFQPYTHKQLQEIVEKRLSGISSFNPDAIQLVARKVASVSGDARRALDICRRAVEIAELEGKHNLVSLMHVNQALNAMITQPKVRAIKNCSRLEKLILQAVVAEVERTGVEETNFTNISKMLVTVAALDGFKMVSSTIAMAAVTRLGLCRLLLIDQKCSNVYQKIILNVSVDDVYYALTKTDI